MLRRIYFATGVAALSAAVLCAQQSKITVRVPRTPADSGKQMYVNHCAPCHGVDGRGHGPTAAALKFPPPDLTTIAKAHNGVFPAEHVEAVLRFGVDNPAHGSKEMPVWGPLLRSRDEIGGTNPEQALRMSNLVRYVKALQVK
jgi:mono/diheme cytochrome c family protein